MTGSTLSAAWRAVWAQRTFRVQTIVTAPALVLTLIVLARFLEQNELRSGVILPDPLLALFQPRDVTWLTFGLIYFGLLIAIVTLVRHPQLLLLAVQSYLVMVIIRIAAMSLVPLEPPPTMLPLHDPLVEHLGTGKLLTKDLFFSGHTSTLFLLFLALPAGRVKIVFLLCTMMVAACVILQHVHYTIDVFAAPFFAYCAFRIAERMSGAAHRSP